jgi:hypothetical protein
MGAFAAWYFLGEKMGKIRIIGGGGDICGDRADSNIWVIEE